MRRFRTVTLGSVVVVALAATHFACVSDEPDVGVDPGIDSGSTDSGAAGDTASPETDSGLAADAAPSLGCPLGCLPPAPAGWTGPSALYEGPNATKPAACPATYLQKEVEAFEGVTAPAAACNCGTPTFNGASCSADVLVYGTSTCASGFPTLEGTATNTAPCVTLGNSGFLKVTAPTLARGTCSFGAVKTTLADAGIGTTDIACGLPQNAVCTGAPSCVATPLPDAPFTRLCIHKDGDLACPSADYPNKVSAFTGIADTRTCSACEGTPTGGACGTGYGVAGSASACAAAQPTTFTTGTCAGTNPGIGAVIGASIAPSGVTCASDGGTPDGSVTTTDPVTFCCNK